MLTKHKNLSKDYIKYSIGKFIYHPPSKYTSDYDQQFISTRIQNFLHGEKEAKENTANLITCFMKDTYTQLMILSMWGAFLKINFRSIKYLVEGKAEKYADNCSNYPIVANYS